jgi:hypothetical protein
VSFLCQFHFLEILRYNSGIIAVFIYDDTTGTAAAACVSLGGVYTYTHTHTHTHNFAYYCSTHLHYTQQVTTIHKSKPSKMEAYDDLFMTSAERGEKDDDWRGTVGTPGLGRADWEEFEDNVLAEARGKAKILSTIKSAVKERNDQDALDIEVDLGCHVVEAVDDILKTNVAEDYRTVLFEGIPAPYPHSTTYQRVIITDGDDEVDRDTKTACGILKRCLDLREKYINHHHITPSPSRKTLARSGSNQFRRRPEPHYNVFDRELPPATDAFNPVWENGIFKVYEGGAEEDAAPTPVMGVISFSEFIVDYNYVCPQLILHCALICS